MPDFKELVKNLYTSKNRDLTPEKLQYIEANYKGKEEDFVKNFYATIGEDLTDEKFKYISDTYLKKKDQPISQGFGIGLEPSQPRDIPSPLIGRGIIDYQERERKAQQAAEKLSNKLNTNLATYMAAQGEEPTREMLGAQEQSAYNQLQAVIQKDLGNKGTVAGHLYNKLLQGTGAAISGGIDAGLNLMKYAQPMSPLINEATILDYRYNIAPDVKNFLREQIGAEVDKGAERKFDEDFITSAVGGLAYSVPAMVTPMGVGLYSQAYDSGLDLINSTEAGKNLTEAEKTLFASALGVTMGTLEKAGLDKIVGRSITPQIARNATFKAIKELSEKGIKITPEAIERLAKKEANNIKNRLVNAGDQTYKAFLDEFTTGGLQEIGTIGLEQSVNALKNKDIFDTQGMGEMFGRVLKSAAQEGIGGGIMGVGKGALPVSTRGYLIKEISNAKSFDDVNRLLRDVESIGIENNYAPEQIDDVVSTVNEIVQLKEKLPPQLTSAQQEGILNLIVERNELSDELQKANADLQNIDPAFADSKNNEIAILEKQINAINNDIKEISENENYAVQIETAGQVPVQPEAQVGGEVAQGEPQTEPQAPAEGIQEKITIGVAPFREINVTSLDQDADLRSTPEYKNYVKNIARISKSLGLKVDQSAETWGGYVDTETGRPVQEVSNMLQIKATPEEARVLAAILGKTAPEMQDSVLVGSFNENGSGAEHTIRTGSFENANKAIEFLKKNGLEYFTIDKNTGDIIILDLDGSAADNIINFNNDLNENGINTEHTAYGVEAEFVGRDDYDGILAEQGRKIAEERGIDIDAIVKSATERFQKTRKQKVEAEPEVKAEVNKIPKGVYTELVARIERSIQNVFGKPDNKIVTLNAKQFQEALKEAQSGEDVRFQAVGAFEKINFSETPEYQKLKEEGKVVEDFDVKDIAGKPIVIINPDNMMTGVILDKNGKPVLNGNGGVNFVSKFGEVWAASNDTTAGTLSNYINTAREKDLAAGGDGTVYVVLTKGDLSKTLTSHTGAKAAMAVLESLSETYNLIGLKDFRSALTKVGKKYKIDFSGADDAKSINKDIASKFFNVSDSTFRERGFFVFDMIDHLSKNSKTAQKNIEGIRQALNSDQLGKKIRLSKGGIVEALGLLFSDPVTQGVKPSNAYAIIEVNKPVKVAKGNHESYPSSIVQEDGSRPKLLLLKNPQDIKAIANDVNNNSVPDYFTNKSGKRTNGVVKLGSNQVGMSAGFIKPADQLSTDFVNYMTNEEGEVYGFEQNGNIFLNGSLLNANTPIHEAGHVWMDWVESNNPDLFFQGLDKVRGTEYLEKVKANKFYQDQANKLPEDRRERYFETEALAKAIGDQGESIVNENKKKSIKAWLKSLWEAVGNRFGIRDMSSEDISNLTLDQFAKLAAGDILSAAEEKGIIKRPAGKLAKIRTGLAKLFKRGKTDVGPAIKPQEFAEFEEVVDNEQAARDLRESIETPFRNEEKLEKTAKSWTSRFIKAAFDSQTDVINKLLDKGGDIGKIAVATLRNRKGYNGKASIIFRSFNKEIFDDLGFTPNIEYVGRKLSERDAFDIFLNLNRIINIDARISDKFARLVQVDRQLKDKSISKEKAKDLAAEKERLETYLKDRNVLDKRSGEYIPKQYKHSQNKTATSARNELKLMQSTNPDLYKKLDKAYDSYTDAFRFLLEEQYKNNLISKEVYDELFSYNYIPTRFIQHFVESELSQDNPALSSKLSSSIKNLTGGSDADVITNFQAILELYTNSVYKRIYENRAANSLARAIFATGEQEKGLMKVNQIVRSADADITKKPMYNINLDMSVQEPIGEDKFGDPTYEDVPTGYDVIYFFRDNGKRERIVASRDFVDTWYDRGGLLSPKGEEYLSLVSKLSGVNLFKSLITKNNPAFGIYQILQDAPQALIATQAYPDFILGSAMLAKDYASVAGDITKFIKDDELTPLFKEAVDAGIFSDFLSTESDILQSQSLVNRDGSTDYKTAAKVLKRKTTRAFDTTLNSIAKFNEAIEYSTRLAVYKRMKQNLVAKYTKENGGVEPSSQQMFDIRALAAEQARNVVDFSRSGTIIKPLNKVFAYLNAGMQAFYSSARSLKNNPTRAGVLLTEIGFGSATIMAMSLGAGGDEKEKKKRLAEYMMLSKYQKANYFNIYNPYSDDPEKSWIRIPKPQPFRGFLTLIEQGYLHNVMRADVDMDQAKEAFMNDIPLDPQWFFITDLITRNPVVNGVIKYSFNYDAFRNQQVVKNAEKIEDWAEGVDDENVGKLYKRLGESTRGLFGKEGASPKRAEAFVESMIGDPARNTTTAILDKGGRSIFYLATGDTKALEQEFGGDLGDNMLKLSGLKGRLFTKTPKLDNAFMDTLDEQRRELFTKRLLIRSDIEQIYNEAGSPKEAKKLAEDRLNELVRNGDIDLKYKKTVINAQEKRASVEGKPAWYKSLLYSENNDEKVQILEHYAKGLSTEEWKEVGSFLLKNKIVSPDVTREFARKRSKNEK